MTGFDRWLLRTALILAVLFFGWQFARQTFLVMLNQSVEIQRLQQENAILKGPPK